MKVGEDLEVMSNSRLYHRLTVRVSVIDNSKVSNISSIKYN